MSTKCTCSSSLSVSEHLSSSNHCHLNHLSLVDSSIHFFGKVQLQDKVCVVYFFFFFYEKFVCIVKSVDPDQTPRSAASDKGLHCVPMFLLFFYFYFFVVYLFVCLFVVCFCVSLFSCYFFFCLFVFLFVFLFLLFYFICLFFYLFCLFVCLLRVCVRACVRVCVFVLFFYIYIFFVFVCLFVCLLVMFHSKLRSLYMHRTIILCFGASKNGIPPRWIMHLIILRW